MSLLCSHLLYVIVATHLMVVVVEANDFLMIMVVGAIWVVVIFVGTMCVSVWCDLGGGDGCWCSWYW